MPGTPWYCKVGIIERAAGVVWKRHAISQLKTLNVRDEGRLRTLFIPTPPPPEYPDGPPPVLKTGNNETPTRGVELSDANVGLLSVGKRNQLRSVLQPQTVEEPFPKETKRVRPCTGR